MASPAQPRKGILTRPWPHPGWPAQPKPSLRLWTVGKRVFFPVTNQTRRSGLTPEGDAPCNHRVRAVRTGGGDLRGIGPSRTHHTGPHNLFASPGRSAPRILSSSSRVQSHQVGHSPHASHARMQIRMRSKNNVVLRVHRNQGERNAKL